MSAMAMVAPLRWAAAHGVRREGPLRPGRAEDEEPDPRHQAVSPDPASSRSRCARRRPARRPPCRRRCARRAGPRATSRDSGRHGVLPRGDELGQRGGDPVQHGVGQLSGRQRAARPLGVQAGVPGRHPPIAPAARGRRSATAPARRDRWGWRPRSPGSCPRARCRAARAGRPARGDAGSARAGRARWGRRRQVPAGDRGRAAPRDAGPSAARAPARWSASKLHGRSGTSASRSKLRLSKGCSGCSNTMASRTRPVGVRTVCSTTSSSSPTGTAGGRRRLDRSSRPA